MLQNQGTVGNGLISPYFARYYEDFSKDPRDRATSTTPRRPSRCSRRAAGTARRAAPAPRTACKATFELLVRQNNQDDQNAAQRYAADAKAVGIDMKLSIVSEDQINERIYATSPTDENKYEPTYDAFYWGWGGDNDSPAFNFDVLVCGSSWQDSMYCNPQYDKLVGDALKELDITKRAALWHDAERIALKDAPYLITDHDNVARRDPQRHLGRATSRSRRARARRSATRGCSCRLIKKVVRRRRQLEHGRDRRRRRRARRAGRDRRDLHAPALEGRSRSSSSRSRQCRGDTPATRALVALGTLVFVLIFNFFLFRAVGDPKKDLIRSRLSPAAREAVIRERGLDKDKLTQFRIYIRQTLQR